MTTPTEVEQHKIDLPKPGEEPAFLPHPLLDHLLEAVIALGAELWVERDRRRILETLLAEKGLVAGDEIENYQLTPQQQETRQAAKQQLIERTLGKLKDLGAVGIAAEAAAKAAPTPATTRKPKNG